MVPEPMASLCSASDDIDAAMLLVIVATDAMLRMLEETSV